MIDPGEVLRPARAAEWIPALQEAVEHVAQDDRAWALGFAAANHVVGDDFDGEPDAFA